MERARVRAHAEAQVLQIFAELDKPVLDHERLFLLRTEVREAMVEPVLDRCCHTCLESLDGDGHCDWCCC